MFVSNKDEKKEFFLYFIMMFTGCTFIKIILCIHHVVTKNSSLLYLFYKLVFHIIRQCIVYIELGYHLELEVLFKLTQVIGRIQFFVAVGSSPPLTC